MANIKAGDTVTFKPEWRDGGDEKITFVAVEDEDDGRVLVEALCGLTINPTQRVNVSMLEEAPACGHPATSLDPTDRGTFVCLACNAEVG